MWLAKLPDSAINLSADKTPDLEMEIYVIAAAQCKPLLDQIIPFM
jgi:hypothetical protein